MLVSYLVKTVMEIDSILRSANIGSCIELACGWRTEIYTPDVANSIRKKLKEFESENFGHVPSDQLEEILNALSSYPAGEAYVRSEPGNCNDGKDKYNDAYSYSDLFVFWYTRKSKVVRWNVNSFISSYPLRKDFYIIRNHGIAWKVLFPERYNLLLHYRNVRKLRPLGVQLLGDLALEEAVDINPKFRLALVRADRRIWLLTPIGPHQVPSPRVFTVAGAYQKITGYRLPRGKNAGWKNIEPAFVMAALGR